MEYGVFSFISYKLAVTQKEKHSLATAIMARSGKLFAKKNILGIQFHPWKKVEKKGFRDF